MKSLVLTTGGVLLLAANSVAAQPVSSPPQAGSQVACPMAGGMGPMAGAGMNGPGMANWQQMHDQMQAMHDQMMAMHKDMQGMHEEMMKLREGMPKHH